jgi:hypothetical protein
MIANRITTAPTAIDVAESFRFGWRGLNLGATGAAVAGRGAGVDGDMPNRNVAPQPAQHSSWVTVS